MDTNKPLSLFLVAILAASVFTVVGITSMPLRDVSAQAATIETSADDHEGRFFGGMLQVIIEDEDTDDDGDDIDVEVTVELDGGDSDTQTITIQNTTDGSQRYEFFLVHAAAADLIPEDPDAAAANLAVFTFGDGGDFDIAGFDLYDSGSVEIEYDGQSVVIDYDESTADLSVDKDAPYGSNSTVYLRVYDPDGNSDPTNRTNYVIPNAEIADLLDISGAFISGDLVLNETSDNSAIFEAELQLNVTDNGLNNELVFEDEVISIEVTDKVNYADVDAAENTSTDTDEVTIEVDDEDGEADEIGDLTFANGLTVTIRDDDQNLDSEAEDVIEDALVVTVDAEDGSGDFVELDLRETDDNTGVFEIDLSNNELRLQFLSDAVSLIWDTGAAGIGNDPGDDTTLQLRQGDITEDILIEYNDPLPDDPADLGQPQVSITREIVILPGQLAAPEQAGVTDEFTVTLTDNDLNTNSRIRDSYSFPLDGFAPWNLTRGADEYGQIYSLEMELNGEAVEFVTPVTVTVTETGVNTGIFEFEIDLDDLTENAEVDGVAVVLEDSDDLEISINDNMDSGPLDPEEDDVTVTIGRADAGLDYSRTTVPLPPTDGTATSDLVGDTVFVTMILVDPVLNTNTNTEDFYNLVAGDLDFTVEVEGGNLDECTVATDNLVGCDIDEAAGITLDDVLTIGLLEETGTNTGVFESELEISLAGIDPDDMDSEDWQDAEITFEYTNNEGDEETAGFTFRGNDGIVTVDQPSATAGTVITITVEDQDLNLDETEVDEFESTIGSAGVFIVGIEGEDDDIAAGETQTFEETGDDTGIFTATFEVGEDIEIVNVDEGDQSSNILITYQDDVDSTGNLDADNEIEVNVPVVSGTGSIQVTPDLVGPATTLTVLIVDSDLDADAGSVDEYDPDDVGDMVEFASSRNEVGEASPVIEETGPNTGVFMFTLELITDAELCADDDLDDGSGDFDATGDDTDSTIGACPGDLISIRYEDEHSGSGAGNTVSEVVEVNSWDPEFVADQDSYSIGDRVTVTISDPDANRDPDVADTLSDIRVTSDSDRVGEEFSAIETGRDTGVFRLTFGTTTGTAGGAISVNQGDDITIEYTDEFPADFVEEEEDKEFQFVVTVGGSTGTDTTVVTPPELQDVTGKKLDEVSVGQQVVLATSVRNNQAGPQPFVALVEVRDDAGVTVFLAWQTGTLTANGQTQVGLSWTPDFAGDYEVRTFVISDLNNPQVLSEVSTSNITVNG